MNTGFICRNTNTAARLVVQVVESPDALSNMSMQKERLSFLAMLVSVTTRIAVAIIIPPKNILNITPFVYNHSRLGIAHASMALLSTQPFISRIILMYWHEIKAWVNHSKLLYVNTLRRNQFSQFLHTYRYLMWIEACLTH